MEEVYVVRRRHLVDGVPIRQIAREMGIDRNTVRRYLRGAPAGVGKPRGALGAPVREAIQGRVTALLEDSKRWTGGKQRLTAARLHELLRREGHEVGYTIVKDLVREWRRARKEVFVPLVDIRDDPSCDGELVEGVVKF
jgi:transposase